MAANTLRDTPLAWLVGILLIVVGMLLGHITTRQAMAEETQRLMLEMRTEYVPRTEVELQLKTINEKLDEIRNDVRQLKEG